MEHLEKYRLVAKIRFFLNGTRQHTDKVIVWAGDNNPIDDSTILAQASATALGLETNTHSSMHGHFRTEVDDNLLAKSRLSFPGVGSIAFFKTLQVVPLDRSLPEGVPLSLPEVS